MRDRLVHLLGSQEGLGFRVTQEDMQEVIREGKVLKGF